MLMFKFNVITTLFDHPFQEFFDIDFVLIIFLATIHSTITVQFIHNYYVTTSSRFLFKFFLYAIFNTTHLPTLLHGPFLLSTLFLACPFQFIFIISVDLKCHVTT